MSFRKLHQTLESDVVALLWDPLGTLDVPLIQHLSLHTIVIILLMFLQLDCKLEDKNHILFNVMVSSIVSDLW